jgi:hypothetical protein
VDREMLLEFQRKLAREALIIVVAEFIKVVGSQAISRGRGVGSR